MHRFPLSFYINSQFHKTFPDSLPPSHFLIHFVARDCDLLLYFCSPSLISRSIFFASTEELHIPASNRSRHLLSLEQCRVSCIQAPPPPSSHTRSPVPKTHSDRPQGTALLALTLALCRTHIQQITQTQQRSCYYLPQGQEQRQDRTGQDRTTHHSIR